MLLKGGRWQQLKLVGFPLGIYDDVTYEEWTLNLDPGNILVLHSDGLFEAADPGRQFLRYPSRIASLIEQNASLSANDLADALLAEVQQFEGNAAITDDRTLVVMESTVRVPSGSPGPFPSLGLVRGFLFHGPSDDTRLDSSGAATISIARMSRSKRSPRASGLPPMFIAPAPLPPPIANWTRLSGKQPHMICYAVKANSNLSILRLLARLGSGFDIVSVGEASSGSSVPASTPSNRFLFRARANRGRRSGKPYAPASGYSTWNPPRNLKFSPARRLAPAAARRRPFA